MQAIQIILFDGDGVLYHRPRQDQHLAHFLEAHGLKLRHPRVVEKALRAARFDVLVGRIPREAYFDAVLRFHGVTDAVLLAEGREVLFYDAADIELFPGVIETLDALQAAGVMLGAVVESPHPAVHHVGWLAEHGLSPGLWCEFVTSCEVGMLLSDLGIFHHTLRRFNVALEQVVYVGHCSEAINCAAESGLITVAFMPDDPALPTDFAIASFFGLPSLFMTE